MRKCCLKGLCVGLLAVLLGTASCRAQEKVVYRDYDRLGWTILDSLKRPGAASLFKGMNTLKLATRMLEENTPVDVEPRPAGKRELKPRAIICGQQFTRSTSCLGQRLSFYQKTGYA